MSSKHNSRKNRTNSSQTSKGAKAPMANEMKQSSFPKTRQAPTSFDFSAPKPRFAVNSTGQGGCKISGCDLVGPVQIDLSAGYQPGDVIMNFVFDPQTIVPNSRLARQQALFQRFKFRKAKVTYVPACGTSVPGSMVMGVIRDPKLTIPAAWGDQGLQTLYATPGCDSGVLWDCHSCIYTSDKATTWCYGSVASPVSSEPLMMFPAQFVLLTQTEIPIDPTDIPSTWGNLFLEYEIDLEEPCLNTPPVGVGQSSEVGDDTTPFNPSITAPIGYDPSSNLTTQLTTSVDGSTGSWLVPLGTYLYQWLTDGDLGTGMDLTACTLTLNDGAVVPQMSMQQDLTAPGTVGSGLLSYLVDVLPPLSSIADVANTVIHSIDPGFSFASATESIGDWLASTAMDLFAFAAMRRKHYYHYRGGSCVLHVSPDDWKVLAANKINLKPLSRRSHRMRESFVFPRIRRILGQKVTSSSNTLLRDGRRLPIKIGLPYVRVEESDAKSAPLTQTHRDKVLGTTPLSKR